MAFPRRPNTDGLFKMVGASFILHMALIAFLSLNPWPMTIKAQPTAYTVTLVPISVPEPEVPKPRANPAIKKESPSPTEKRKPIEKPKKDDIVEPVKKPIKKTEKSEEKDSLKDLQEAIEEIRRKAAIDEIRKRVAQREKIEEKTKVAPPTVPPPTIAPPTVVPSHRPSTSSLKTSPAFESQLDVYYSLVCAQIKEAWTIPENLLKEMVDLETIIVIIVERDGKIQKSWFEKKSGNALYDQMAMRAIKKAEPLPPIPRELSENTFEIGIRFFPD